MTRWRAFVFADPLLATVLDELAGEQLAQSDIRVIPLPTGTHPAPEIALLADLTAAPLILLLTHPQADEIAQQRDRPVRDHPPAETASAAGVLNLAIQLELDLEIVSLTIGHPASSCTPTRSAVARPAALASRRSPATPVPTRSTPPPVARHQSRIPTFCKRPTRSARMPPPCKRSRR